MNIEERLYSTIVEFHRSRGYSPSIRDLQTVLNVRSMSTIHRALVSLRTRGLIEWDEGRYRTIRPVA